MIDKQEILMRLACAALQGGMTIEEIVDGLNTPYDGADYSLWDVASAIYPDTFKLEEKDEPIINTKNNMY